MTRTLHRAGQIHRLVREIARDLRRRHDHRRRPIRLQATVVQPKRIGDHPRILVVLQRDRPPVHHRARIALRVLVRRHRDLPQLRRGGAVLVHMTPSPHRQKLRRRHQALRHVERVRPAQPPRPTVQAEAPELALRQRPIDHDEPRVARMNPRRRVPDRRADAAAAARRRPCSRSRSRAGRAPSTADSGRCGRPSTTRTRQSAAGPAPHPRRPPGSPRSPTETPAAQSARASCTPSRPPRSHKPRRECRGQARCLPCSATC